LLVVTPKGGHLGWVAGDEAPLGSPWTDPLIIDFLEFLETQSAATKAPQAAGKEYFSHVEV
jgi:predicted alpha/beta-fold hydrolase